MAAVYAFLALLCATTVHSSEVEQDACSAACDLLRKDDLATSIMYQIFVNNIQYYPGRNIKVTASGHNDTFPFHTVVIQAKSMGDNEPVGVMVGENNAILKDCNGDGQRDTVCMTSYNKSLGLVQAMWHPPETPGIVRFAEIQAAFIDMAEVVHHQHSVVMSENITLRQAPEKPEVDMHSDKTEMELVIIQKEKEQKMIEMENIGSEDNLGIREREEEQERQRELRWEETQYEQALKEEEELLRKRIQEELRDKEEYDRLKYEREQREREEHEREEREREERERREREREEREREERERKEREREERERENEIDLNEDKDKQKPTAGSVRVTVTFGFVILLSAFVLGM